MGLLLSPHTALPASPWVQRWSHLIGAGTPVLDLACGTGRHVRWFCDRGHPVIGVDVSAQALQSLSDLAQAGRAELLQADLEAGTWPLGDGPQRRRFGAVVVTNYLWRPLFPALCDSLADGGVLLYETFAHGNAEVGKPSRPDFLLQPGELLARCAGLRIVAYEDGFRADPARFVQRIVAVRPVPEPAGPVARFALPS